MCHADAAVLDHAGACRASGRCCWAYFSPQPICISQVSTDLTVILTKTTTAPVSAIAFSPCVCNAIARYPRCLPSQVSETRTLLLKLMGSDPQAPPAQWEVLSGLEPWLTINGFHVSSPPLSPPLSQTCCWCCVCRSSVPNVLQNLAQPQVDANNSLTVPSVNGKRLDQTTAWIVEVSVTISPIGLAERPEPCAAYRPTCTCTTAFTSTTLCMPPA